MSLNHDLSGLFSTMADIMDIKGENTFKVLAFRKVGRILKETTLDIRKCVADGSLGEVEGIGAHSQRIIEEYVNTGRSTQAEELIQSLPAGLIPLLQVEGLGPKTIALLWKQKKITSADQLMTAIDDGSLLDLKGIGEKKLAGIRRGLENAAKAGGRRGIGEVMPVAQELLARVRQLPGVLAAEIAGSLRRWRETIGDVDLLCAVGEDLQGSLSPQARREHAAQWLAKNLEYLAFPFPYVQATHELRVSLQNAIGDLNAPDDLKAVLRYIEDRLMVQYRGSGEMPRFNKRAPEFPADVILAGWKQVDQRLAGYVHDCIEAADAAKHWAGTWDPVLSKEPGVYIFRPKGGEISMGYVGIAGKRKDGGLNGRIGKHYKDTSLSGDLPNDSLQKNIARFLAATNSETVIDAFVRLPGIDRVLGHGPTKASVVTASGLQVDLRALPQEHFGAALLYFTGSKEHNVRIRGLALKKGLTLNEWGLYKLDEYDKADKKTSEAPAVKPVASKTEEEIYGKLGLPFIEPELREDRGEVDAALEHRLPKLITREDLRGDLHTHTTASDGTASIEEMAEAAKACGYEYLAITDHSKSQVIANGLSAERLLKHVAEIRKVGQKLKGITLLAGCEVDILADGHLDFEDEVLKELDVVIASPHFALKQDQQKATDRLLRAIGNRYVNIIGHPTGRLINQREGLPLDFATLFKAAGSHTAMEINAGYPRLDLDELNSRSAIAASVMLSINTDAHSIQGLSEIAFGLAVARRAWVTAGNVINCMKIGEMREFLAAKR